MAESIKNRHQKDCQGIQELVFPQGKPQWQWNEWGDWVGGASTTGGLSASSPLSI